MGGGGEEESGVHQHIFIQTVHKESKVFRMQQRKNTTSYLF
jgi:hypothetical protein